MHLSISVAEKLHLLNNLILLPFHACLGDDIHYQRTTRPNRSSCSLLGPELLRDNMHHSVQLKPAHWLFITCWFQLAVAAGVYCVKQNKATRGNQACCGATNTDVSNGLCLPCQPPAEGRHLENSSNKQLLSDWWSSSCSEYSALLKQLFLETCGEQKST